MRALLASALLLTCVPAGLNGNAAPAPSVTAAPTAAVVPPESPLEDGSCKTEDELRAKLESFTSALNAGDAAALERSLSPVLWAVSALDPAPWAVYGKTEALRELLRRHATGERWRFVSFTQTTLQGWDGASHFGLHMERTVAGRLVMHQGKGALFCRGRWEGIEVLGLGSP
jgi:hypothetical protein